MFLDISKTFSQVSEEVKTSQVLEDITSIFANYGFQQEGAEYKPYMLRKTEIYYDRPFNGKNLGNYLFCGGFCRQVVFENEETKTADFYVEYEESSGSKVKKYKVNRPVSADEIKVKLGIRGKMFGSNLKVESDVLVIPFVQRNTNGEVCCVVNFFVENAKVENIYSKDKKQIVFFNSKMLTKYKYMYKNTQMGLLYVKMFYALEDYLRSKNINESQFVYQDKYSVLLETYFQDVGLKAVPLPF